MFRRVSLLAVAIACVLPVSAHAAVTYTVDPAAAAGCDASNVCKTIIDANAKVADGDTVNIKDGAYKESGPIVVTKSAVTFKGTLGKVAITQTDGKLDTPVFRLGPGTTLDGLAISVQPNGAQAVVATQSGALVRNSTLARAGTNTTNAPVVASTAIGGVVSLEGVVVLQAGQAPGSTHPPAVAGAPSSSLAISASSIVSATGPGVVLQGADATSKQNTIVGTQIFALPSDGDAIVVANAADQTIAQQLLVDSSILGPGADGTGIAASSAATSAAKGAPVSVNGVHVTIAGGGEPVTAAAAAQPTPIVGGVAGPVAITLDRSIAHGKVKSTTTTGAVLLGPTSVATVKIQNSDATDTGGAGVTVSNNTTAADDALFVDAAKKNFHLKIGSPAIDKAGDSAPGESAKDVDGQARKIGGSTDLGADEFINLPPFAILISSATTVRAGQTVLFDGSRSVDLEGAGITKYQWDFGDGKTAETTTPSTDHVYDTVGAYTPTLTVTDAQGNVGPAFKGALITVLDGVGPALAITAPKDKRTLHVFKTTKTKTRTTKTRQLFRFAGTATDDSGVQTVVISLRRVSLTKTATSAAVASTCVYLDGKTKFLSKNCKTPVYFNVHLNKDGSWAYRTKAGTIFRAGSYELSAIAKDTSGALSTTKVTFTLK